MNTWHEAALAYREMGLTHKEIASKIESEFGLEDMYNKVRGYVYRQGCKKKAKPVEKKSFDPEPGARAL